MNWASLIKKKQPPALKRPDIPRHAPDWARLVSLDFETYWDTDYTLKKLSTSEYVRDPRFKAQMVGIKIGNGKTKIVTGKRIGTELKKINWDTHSVLCHNTQFDGLVLSHHYGIRPAFLYDTLSMARGLHSNDIGAGLDEVSMYYGGQGKIKDTLEKTLGVLNWSKELIAEAGVYCANDVDEMVRVFKEMLPKMPADEIELIHLTCKMFCDPVLKVDIPRVEAELARELAHRETLMYAAVNPKLYDIGGKLYDKADHAKFLKGPEERALTGVERDMQIIKRIIGSNERFADLLRAEGVEPPVKISPAWIKKDKALRTDEGKWAFAFAKDDAAFIELPNRVNEWGFDLNKPADVKLMAAKQERLQALVDVRITVKSTTNVTRAQRFLTAGANGMSLPVGYAYYRAHCVPGDTEVLTRAGWQRIDEWHGGEIAQVSPDQSIEFLPATCFAGPPVRNWVHIDAPYLKGDFTFGHTMPYLKQKTFAWATETAREFARIAVRDVPLAGTLIGEGKITAVQMRVLAMVQADGSFEEATSIGRRMSVFVKKPRKIARARQVLEAAGVPYEEQTYESWPGFVRFVVRYRDYPEWMTTQRKFFGSWLLDSTSEAREALIDELQHWDGWVSKGGTLCYSTSEPVNAEWITTLCHLVGRCASTYAAPANGKRRENYTVSIRQRSRGLVRNRHMLVGTHAVARNSFCAETQTGFWLARSSGRIFVTGNTGRWGGQDKMNMQNLVRGGELRLSILAPKGYMVAVQDSGQIEARVNGWLWGQHDLLDAFRAADVGTGRDAYCNFGDSIYGRVITKADTMERFVGKVCIAEGEMVLTDRGLVPINLISKEDRLWDGVEWVTHDGVIDQGIKEVITYDGLTATPDHEVFTEDGRIIPLGQAASEMARLQRTGAEGRSIRFCDDHVVADTPRKRLSVRVGAMQPERGQKTDLPEQPEKRQDNIVLEERASSSSPCGSLGSTIRRDSRQVQRPSAQALGELRRAGDQMLVQDQDELHPVGLYESAARGLQGGGDRQGGQRRALCAREFEVGYTAGKHTKPTQHSEDHVVGQTLALGRFPESVQQDLDIQARGVTGADRGANLRKVRVYDIANAGPRLRYTVSNKLVFNCVLGLGFQMGAEKLQTTLAKGALGGPPVYFELDRCKMIINTYRSKNYAIANGWNICKGIIEDMATGREGSHGPIHWEKETIWLPNGMCLKYPDLKMSVNDKGWDEWTYQSKDMRKKIYGGLLCENIVQALARIIVAWQMLQISRKYRIVMMTHDEVVALPKKAQADACMRFMAKWMKTAPDWCPDIPLNCEGGYDVNYGK